MELLGQNKIDHHQRQVAILSQDSFYRELTPEQKAKALKGQFNFDHPGMNTCGGACTLAGPLHAHVCYAHHRIGFPGSCLANLWNQMLPSFSSWNWSWVMYRFQGRQFEKGMLSKSQMLSNVHLLMCELPLRNSSQSNSYFCRFY